MSQSEPDKKDLARAEFAIRCRKVRLYLAKNPGLTSYEIGRGVGFNAGWALARMSAMKLVGFTQERQPDGRRPQKWFVIPQ